MSEKASDIRSAAAPKLEISGYAEPTALDRKNAIADSMVSLGVPGAAELEAKQRKEKKEVDDRYATMREVVKKLHEIQKKIYDSLGILPKTEDNSWTGKFKKWIVDALIADNLDFIKVIAEQGVESVLKALASMFSSVEAVSALMKSAYEGMKSKAASLLDLDAYSMGKSLWWMGFGLVWMVRSWVREGVVMWMREAVQSTAHLATFKIPLGHPPVVTWTRIYECAELVERELVRKWPEEVTKVLNLIESTGQYLAKHGHEAKWLALRERNEFEWSLRLLVNRLSSIVRDERIPMFDRQAIASSMEKHLLPAHKEAHKLDKIV